MESSQSVPSNLYSSTTTIVPIHKSASVQSHLSTPSSQQVQRIRNANLNNPPAGRKKNSLPDHDIEANHSQASSPLSPVSLLSACLPQELQVLIRRLTLRRWLRWMLGIYCLFSVVFLSTRPLRLSTARYAFSSWMLPSYDVDSPTTSYIEALPKDTVLSKLTPVYPQPGALVPYVLKADIQLDTVTACLWTNESDLDLLPGWMSKWPGLVSVLVVSSAQPDSPEFNKLSQKLSFFHSQFSRRDWLSLHVVQVDPQTPANPNAFLNLARLLSQTSRVALFPANLSVIPTKALYRSYFSDSSSSAKNISHRPMIFTSRGHTSYPFSALAPIVLNRDDSLWCTERFFPFVSREQDWAECMWQVWLEHFGDIDIKQTTDWVRASTAAPEPTSMANKLRRRLSAKYRSETCMLATRHLAALKAPERRGVEAKKTRWLKRNCREWMTLA